MSETAAVALARVIAPLDAPRAATLRDSFGAMFDRVEQWQVEARGLVVTAEDQVGRMQRAKSLRLEIRAARVALDKKRKELKAGVLVEGRAIDGAYAVFEGLAAPLEEHLRAQELFAERAEEARRDALLDARQAVLLALDTPLWEIPADLGAMSETAWVEALATAREAKATRARREAEAAEARAAEDRARKAREEEQRRENERLQEERRAADRKARAAEREVAELRAAEDARLAREAERGKPTKAKYVVLLEALRAIVETGERKSGRLAREALKQVGEE